MNLGSSVRWALAGATLALLVVAPAPVQAQQLEYPKTAKVDVVENYHGTEVADPYRWLEDADAAETAAWVEAQNKITFAFLDAIPEREAIRRRLTELWNYERYTTPFKEGG
jgi:prolyl oligopeptidase